MADKAEGKQLYRDSVSECSKRHWPSDDPVPHSSDISWSMVDHTHEAGCQFRKVLGAIHFSHKSTNSFARNSAASGEVIYD